MIQGAMRMSCGACGHQDFAVYQFTGTKMVVECLKCKSTTIVAVSVPYLRMDFGERSEGVLCIMPSSANNEKGD